MSADLTTLGLAVLDAQEIHGAAELVIALEHLLDNSGGIVVMLALIAAIYRVAMRVVERWQPPRRRAADTIGHNISPQSTENTPPSPPPVANIPTVMPSPPPANSPLPLPQTNTPPAAAPSQ